MYLLARAHVYIVRSLVVYERKDMMEIFLYGSKGTLF